MYEHLKIEERGAVAVMTISAPKSLNALNSTILKEMEEKLPGNGVCRRPHALRHEVDVAHHVTRHHLADADVGKLPDKFVTVICYRDARLAVEIEFRRDGAIRRVHARRAFLHAEIAVHRIDEERVAPDVAVGACAPT